MIEDIMIVLKQAADMEINLNSETARRWLAETIYKKTMMFDEYKDKR
tara:strand:- start:415 stop:555 length:141 start_codon:yes stop_codon:yes gene_type:complete